MKKIKYLKSWKGKLIDWQDWRYTLFLIKEDDEKLKQINNYLNTNFIEQIDLKNRIDWKLSWYSIKYRLYKKV